MGHVADQLDTTSLGLLQRACHLVEARGELSQLVARVSRWNDDTFGVMAATDTLRCVEHLLYGTRNLASDKVAQHERANSCQYRCQHESLHQRLAKGGVQALSH